MAHKSPRDGGCWYCHDDAGAVAFTGEFDAFVHAECVRAALLRDPGDREAAVIARDIGLPDAAPATPQPPPAAA